MEPKMDRNIATVEKRLADACQLAEDVKLVIGPLKMVKHLFPVQIRIKLNRLLPKLETDSYQLVEYNRKLLAELKLFKVLDTTTEANSIKIEEYKEPLEALDTELDTLKQKMLPLLETIVHRRDQIMKLVLEEDAVRNTMIKDRHTARNEARSRLKRFTKAHRNIKELRELNNIIYKSSISHEWRLNFNANPILNQLNRAEQGQLAQILDDVFRLEEELLEYESNTVSVDERCMDRLMMDSESWAEIESEELAEYKRSFMIVLTKRETIKNELVKLVEYNNKLIKQYTVLGHKLQEAQTQKSPSYETICADLKAITELINNLRVPIKHNQ